MRHLPWLARIVLTLAISLALASTVEARHFWQTFGSTVPSADGGCSWNQNQDYFVPRHASSGRYGLFSPCKSSSTGLSSASPYSHPQHLGYSDIYGSFHYDRRNHVYGAYCGCSPILSGGANTSNVCASIASFGTVCSDVYSNAYSEPVAPLYNVEPAQLDILGSIPVEGSGLLTQGDLQLGNLGLGGAGGQMPLPTQNPMQLLQGLPGGLNLPQFPQP